MMKSCIFYAAYLYHITAPLYIVNLIIAIILYNDGKQIFIWRCLNIYSIISEWMEITYSNWSWM
jgi:hypothetical protein